MIKDKYRLNEYLITEYDGSLYTWETHIGLGSQRSGNCFVLGNILVLVPWSSEEAGFLKLEFYEHLMKLKVWNKTLYYSMSSALRDVRTGQRFSERLCRQKESDQTLETGIFRLGQYEITIEADCNITWQLYKGANKIAAGSCMVESGVLFIRSAENEFLGNQSKKQWLDYLKSLPNWDKTSVWSYRKVLYTCDQGRFAEKKINLEKSI